jgi:uncharacterized cupredoxin-like copper-binding protein
LRIAAVVVLALGVALALAPSGRSEPRSVALITKEFLFIPKDTTVGTGAITFVVTNQGQIDHDFVLEAPGGKTQAQIAYIERGQTKTVTASLPAGVYTIYCSLPGHREAGMVATLRVSP